MWTASPTRGNCLNGSRSMLTKPGSLARTAGAERHQINRARVPHGIRKQPLRLRAQVGPGRKLLIQRHRPGFKFRRRHRARRRLGNQTAKRLIEPESEPQEAHTEQRVVWRQTV